MPLRSPTPDQSPTEQLETSTTRTLLNQLHALRDTMSARIDELAASVERLRVQAAELERVLVSDNPPIASDIPPATDRNPSQDRPPSDIDSTSRPPPARDLNPPRPLPAALTTPLSRMPRSHDPGRWISEDEMSLILDRASRAPIYLHVHPSSSRLPSRASSPEPSPRNRARVHLPSPRNVSQRRGLSPTNTGPQRASTPIVVRALEAVQEDTTISQAEPSPIGETTHSPSVSDSSDGSTGSTVPGSQLPAEQTNRAEAADEMRLFSSLVDSFAESTDPSDSALFSSSPLLEEIGVSGIPLPPETHGIILSGWGIPLDAHQPRSRPSQAATPSRRGERRDRGPADGLTTRGRRVLARQGEPGGEAPEDPNWAPWEAVLFHNRPNEPAPIRRTTPPMAVSAADRRPASSDSTSANTRPPSHRAHVHARVTISRGSSRSNAEGVILLREGETLDAADLRALANDIVRHRFRTPTGRPSENTRDQAESRSRMVRAGPRSDLPREEQAMRSRAGQRGWTGGEISVPVSPIIRRTDGPRTQRDLATGSTLQQQGPSQREAAQPALASVEISTRRAPRLRPTNAPGPTAPRFGQTAAELQAQAASLEARRREGEARTDRLLRESLDANERFRHRIRELIRLRAELAMLRTSLPLPPTHVAPNDPSSDPVRDLVNTTIMSPVGSGLPARRTSSSQSDRGHDVVQGEPSGTGAREERERRSSMETVRGERSSGPIVARRGLALDEMDAVAAEAVAAVAVWHTDGMAERDPDSRSAEEEDSGDEEGDAPLPGSVGTCGPVDEGARLDAHLWPVQMVGTHAVDPPYVSMLDLDLL
ncbi:hypothetical protein DB88DRAFT_482638 [Papiliotrema laurentii]|uniref:Uncharacterized protein n=1 Tax=Papiliotrema laurentii TaxID=5418 RepID=A0AAD9FUS7_PAPLA|nr:hypothetical protein DB88DRAFT_482638 [Papiliotrema laurentii]